MPQAPGQTTRLRVRGIALAALTLRDAFDTVPVPGERRGPLRTAPGMIAALAARKRLRSDERMPE